MHLNFKLLLLSLCACTSLALAAEPKLAQWRDLPPWLRSSAEGPVGDATPLAGGGTVIGPSLPFGSIHPCPNTQGKTNTGYNAYKPIFGFGQLSVSGTSGGGAYGHVILSPQIGLATAAGSHDSEKSNEVASPGYYAVKLTRYDILAEVTPTHHTAIYRFTFPSSEDAHLVLDAGSPRRSTDSGELTIQPDGTISGTVTVSGGWLGKPIPAYWVMQTSRRPIAFGTFLNDTLSAGAEREKSVKPKDRFGAYLRFSIKADEPLLVKGAVSLRSVEQAKKWLDTEQPKWDFEGTAKSAMATWDRALGAIEISGGTPLQRQTFYTLLMHTMIMPRDRTKDGPVAFGDMPYWDDQYTTWDTWRTLFSLMSLINTDMVRGNVNSYIARHQVLGRVDDAFVGGAGGGTSNAHRQGGDNPTNVITDAYVKRIDGIDWKAAAAIVKQDAENRREATYRANGWSALGTLNSPVSHTLEFAYNDACAAVLARGLKMPEADAWAARSKRWDHLWNPETESQGFRGFVQPRKSGNSWLATDPTSMQNWTGPAFQEGSAWIYSYFAPHDHPRLIALHGGPKAFVTRLEHALTKKLIDYGNEPSFLTLRLFIDAGRPDLCSYWVRRAMNWYGPFKMPGDDDSGAMSSWYVLSAIGLFPNAGSDIFYLNSPTFPKVALHLANGRTLTISAPDTSATNLYIASATLNGKPLDRAWLRYEEIMAGGKLEFTLSDKPTNWAQNAPPPPMEFSQRRTGRSTGCHPTIHSLTFVVDCLLALSHSGSGGSQWTTQDIGANPKLTKGESVRGWFRLKRQKPPVKK